MRADGRTDAPWPTSSRSASPWCRPTSSASRSAACCVSRARRCGSSVGSAPRRRPSRCRSRSWSRWCSSSCRASSSWSSDRPGSDRDAPSAIDGSHASLLGGSVDHGSPWSCAGAQLAGHDRGAGLRPGTRDRQVVEHGLWLEGRGPPRTLAIVGGACCGCRAARRSPRVPLGPGRERALMVGLLIGSAGLRAAASSSTSRSPPSWRGSSTVGWPPTNTSLASVPHRWSQPASADPPASPGCARSAAVAGSIGLGAGLLAATRRVPCAAGGGPGAVRRSAPARGQLHPLARGLPGLDARAADARRSRPRRPHRAARTSVCRGRSRRHDLEPRRCARRRPPEDARRSPDSASVTGSARPGAVALPLRVGQHVFGAVVLGRSVHPCSVG